MRVRFRRTARRIALLILAMAVSHAMASVRAAEENGRYLGPCDLVVTSQGTTLCVACSDAHQVAWVDLGSSAVVRRITLPGEPAGLALTPDETKLVVACAAPRSTVAVLDAVSGQQLAAIPAGHTAGSPTIHPDGKRVYVCNRFNHDVSVIDLPAGREVARVPTVREPIAVALTPDGHTLLVANHLPNTRTDRAFTGDVAPVVTLIDTRTHETSSILLPHGANGLRDICVSPDGKHAFVTHLLSNFEMIPFRVDMGWINTNVLTILDLEQRKVISKIGMDEYDQGAANPWAVAHVADAESVCVSLAGAHELCVIASADLLGDVARRTMQPMMGVWPIYISLGSSLWRRIELPGKGPRAMAVAGSKVYVAQYFSDNVAVVDLNANGGELVGAIALGPAPQLSQERRGELLFHDADICYQQWQSCASCHPDARVDGINWDLMNDGADNHKNTKSMLLAHQTPPAMAEGVRMSAEEAVRSGIAHILFTHQPEEEAEAIDAYLRALKPVPSPYLVDGQLSPTAGRGRELFHSERIACHRCHPAPLYTDLKSHNVGSQSPKEHTDRFDTPTLVEVWRTAPYLHDGRYTTVKELLVEGKHGLRGERGESLSEGEIEALVEFVLSL